MAKSFEPLKKTRIKHIAKPGDKIGVPAKKEQKKEVIQKSEVSEEEKAEEKAEEKTENFWGKKE